MLAGSWIVTWCTRVSPGSIAMVATQSIGTAPGSGAQPSGGAMAVIGASMFAPLTDRRSMTWTGPLTGAPVPLVMAISKVQVPPARQDSSPDFSTLSEPPNSAQDWPNGAASAPGPLTRPVAQLRAGSPFVSGMPTSKLRVTPGASSGPGMAQVSVAAGTGEQVHSGPSGMTARTGTGAPPPIISATSSTSTTPSGAAVPLLVTVMRQREPRSLNATHSFLIDRSACPPGRPRPSVEQERLLARLFSFGTPLSSTQFSTARAGELAAFTPTANVAVAPGASVIDARSQRSVPGPVDTHTQGGVGSTSTAEGAGAVTMSSTVSGPE